MSRSKQNSKWLEIGIAVIVGFFICAMVNWTFRGFAVLIYLAIVSTAIVVLAVMRRGMTGFAIACLPLAACLLGITALLPKVFPWQLAELPAASYTEAPLVEVLADLALEKDEAPTWRFQIATNELARTPVSITIPAQERLGNTLERLAESTGAKLDWHWHKMTGKEPAPLCAIFSFRPANQTKATVQMPAVTVSMHGTFWNETVREISRDVAR